MLKIKRIFDGEYVCEVTNKEAYCHDKGSDLMENI